MSTIERIISYILGAIAGAGAGALLVVYGMPVNDPMCEEVIRQLMPLIGLLLAMLIVEYKHVRLMKHENALRDETVALITHEMRTSLTSTGWAIGMMLKKYQTAMEESDTKLLQGVVDSIHTTVMHSVNLLDVSLLDIGKLAISLQWTELAKVDEMFKEMVNKYTLGMKGKGIEFKPEIQLRAEKMVEVDMMRLRIIVENLLENAIQYTLGTEKVITLSVSNDDTDMHITVSDTGMGIPEVEKTKIFSEFYRASNARKALSTGSGIGLFTCAKYVKAHRGEIRFESTEGKGTTFFINIPLKTEADVKGFIQKI